MFNNLIESSSHAKEFKRRGSFLLFTTATYLVLFVITGVVSIYAYDAHLESQNTELEITFVPLREAEPAPPPKNTIPASNPDRSSTESVRTALYTSVSDPTKVPTEVSNKAQPVPPATQFSKLGSYNADLPTPPGSDRGVPDGTGSTPVVNFPENPPPPPEERPVIPKVVRMSAGVLKGNAISLPQPVYPHIAKQINLQGSVSVQILIDEVGNVVSAEIVSGHPILNPEAKKAALRARFTPTKLSGVPVKVSGVIVYKFGIQ
jgi:protein TonB